MDTSSIPGLELMQIADVVAREKSIDREEVVIPATGLGGAKVGNDQHDVVRCSNGNDGGDRCWVDGADNDGSASNHALVIGSHCTCFGGLGVLLKPGDLSLSPLLRFDLGLGDGYSTPHLRAFFLA